jgi:hypothetical protein
MAAKRGKKAQGAEAEQVLTPEQQFAAAREQLTEFQKTIYGLCITPDPVDPQTGQPKIDPETGKAEKAKEPTDVAGKVKSTVSELHQTYRDTIKDATGTSVKKTPISQTATALTGIRRELVNMHRHLGELLTSIADAEQSYKEQVAAAKTSLDKKRNERAERERKKIEKAQQVLAQLGATA